MHALSGQHTKPYWVNVTLNNVPVEMGLDTGADVSVISDMMYIDIQHQSFASPFPHTETVHTSCLFWISYPVTGSHPFRVCYDIREVYLSIHVVKESGPNLMGRD